MMTNTGTKNVTTTEKLVGDDRDEHHHEHFLNPGDTTRNAIMGLAKLKTANNYTLHSTMATTLEENSKQGNKKVNNNTATNTQVKRQRSTTLTNESAKISGGLLNGGSQGGILTSRAAMKRRRSNFSPLLPSFASSSSSGFRMKKLPTPGLLTEEPDRGMSSRSSPEDKYNYIPAPDDVRIDDDDDIITAGETENGIDIGVSRRLLDIHQISTRLHRSFPWEGLGFNRNYNTSHWSGIITNRIGALKPADAPHTLVFSSFYIVPLILLLGIVIALIWLLCACLFHTMNKIRLTLCPGRWTSSEGRNSSGKKGKKSNKAGNNADGGGCSMEEKKPEILTPEMLEMRRQERLAFLQAECANLEQQLTEEKSATLTSRASDSDLEYLGASESPPLKRNSISLQDIPQSVIRIRREKELRQIKEEIEYLRSAAQQEREKTAAQAAKFGLKGSFLITQDFELPGSKPDSPNETKVEPLSQHISHLKTQRKLNEIRTELEDLAIQLLHADEIKAKRCSLQELPRTAINIQREKNLVSMTNEIQKKNYKLQQKNVIQTALEKTTRDDTKSATAGSKSFKNSINENPSNSEDTAAKYSDPEFVHRSSIKRHREQELNRVRVELKDLAYKLNLNPMNYISEDRVRLVPSQSMQSTSSITGGGSGGQSHKSTSTSSALNHV